MMISNTETLLPIVILLLVFVMLSKTKQIRRIFLMTTILVLASYIVLSLLRSNPVMDLYTQITLTSNTIDNLILEDGELKDEITKERVTYYVYEDKVKHEKWYPVYMKSFDGVYLMVFSTDSSKTMSDGLFFQDDYEYNHNADKLVIVSKETGFIRIPRTYELIGQTVDLSLTEKQGSVLSFPVNHPYSRTINFYFSIYVYDQSVLYTMTNLTSFSSNGRYIIHHAFTETDVLTVYNNGDISLLERTFTVYIESIEGKTTITGSSSSGKYLDILDDDTVKEGYFISINNTLYVLRDDLGIYKFIDGGFVFIKQLTSSNHFFTEVSTLT